MDNQLYKFISQNFTYNRSITGNGNLLTLKNIKKINPNLKIKYFNSGKNVFDWIVPDQWEVDDAYIIKPNGERICDFKKNNLHLVGYSYPINKTINLEELNKHLHSLKNQKNAIPYVTSYYKKNWGFCLTHKQRSKLKKGKYKVFINSKILKGKMHYGEILIKGKSKKEILLSTYICHPSMANNELSGLSVCTYLAKYFTKQSKENFYSYRILFLPETIGSIAYIHKNLKTMKRNIIAGYVVTCVGDERNFSYMPSRNGNTISDKIAKHVLFYYTKNKFLQYSWLDRGSDERQFCSPFVDLPIASVMRSKYNTYPEYHTSLDILDKVVTNKGLQESYKLYLKILKAIEINYYPKVKIFCEPNLGKRNLYPTISIKDGLKIEQKRIKDIISYSDGKNSLLTISSIIGMPIWETYEISLKLKKIGILNLNRK